MANKQVDILIIGGGLTGATLMLALQGLGLSVLLVEAKPFSDKTNPDFDARSLALSPASKAVLSKLGVWEYLQHYAASIESIHVSEQQRFGFSRLEGAPNAPLGYVLEMQYINHALQRLLPSEQLLTPASLKSIDFEQQIATISCHSEEIQIKTKLIVAADGTDSAVRKITQLPCDIKDYDQYGVVANIGLVKSHNNRAYERFTAHGPLALLPMQGNRMSLVWANHLQKTNELMHQPEQVFLRELQQAFGYRLGRFVKVGKRFSYPLKQSLMPQQVKWPVVFVGNAAHTLHPVGGQGFNLGLRDVAALAQCINRWGLTPKMLEQYVLLREPDQKIITSFTNSLIHLFTSRLPGIGVARNLGLLAFDTVPGLKNLLVRYAQGFGGEIPDLACGIDLTPMEVSNESSV